MPVRLSLIFFSSVCGTAHVDVCVSSVLTAASWVGTVDVATNSVTLSPAGLPAVALHTTASGQTTNHTTLRIPLGAGPVGVSTTPGRSVEDIQSLLKTAMTAEEERLD